MRSGPAQTQKQREGVVGKVFTSQTFRYSIPRICMKMLCVVVHPYDHSAVEAAKGGPLRLSGQSSLVGKLQVNERACIKEVDSILDDGTGHPWASICMCIHTLSSVVCTHTYTCILFGDICIV